jgi:hypothetical protein
MAIIVKTRRGYYAYTDYDILDNNRLTNLIQRIRHIGNNMINTNSNPMKAYRKACLKFIAITLHQQDRPNHKNTKKVWRHLLAYIKRPKQAELEMKDPEHLFTPPSDKKKSGSPRKATRYEANRTYALKTTDGLNNNQALSQAIQYHANDIKEHAMRRVELFFLLCIALYKTNRVILLSETNKQHGKATAGLKYAACHSSLFTGIEDKSPNRKTRTSSREKSILDDTHFAEVLNATVELPDCVNKFDSLCEGKNGAQSKGLRKQLQPVLQKVAQAKITPIQAMTYFFQQMNVFFTTKAMHNAAQSTQHTPAAIKQHILTLEQQGTLYWTDNTNKKPSVAAVATWLRASPSSAALLLTKPKIANKSYRRRQNEILCSK